MFSNSCLVFNLNYYKFVVLDVHTLLFSILISTTGMIHLNKEKCRIHEGYRALIQPKDVGVCIPVVFKESCNFLRCHLTGALINQEDKCYS